jgi:hypothetical protein
LAHGGKNRRRKTTDEKGFRSTKTIEELNHNAACTNADACWCCAALYLDFFVAGIVEEELHQRLAHARVVGAVLPSSPLPVPTPTQIEFGHSSFALDSPVALFARFSWLLAHQG